MNNLDNWSANKMRFTYLAFALILLVLLSQTTFADTNKINMVHAGKEGYHLYGNDEQLQGDYFAIVCQGARECILKRSQVNMKAKRFDSYDGMVDGFELTSNFPQSLFLVKGIKGLSESALQTWYYDKVFLKDPFDASKTGKLTNTYSKTLNINQEALKIYGQWTKEKVPNCRDEPCTGKVMQWKYSYLGIERTLSKLGTDPIASDMGDWVPSVDFFLVWVGDLDGDNQPDLLVRPSNRTDSLDLELYLSTQLLVGQPWKPAAHFHYWDPTNPGC